ncbi:uncharacterized protein LOC62_04G005354 [Vanrija pseudolonga]|uniref:Uncharacterized protein n=1 Tax=Vanrija pseudolonga TaxID=143232 RepID=A0AAF1BI33_9TREE|nr:hypothetical protein LOC62_04G005354 [Vanrija pseudolonga]
MTAPPDTERAWNETPFDIESAVATLRSLYGATTDPSSPIQVDFVNIRNEFHGRGYDTPRVEVLQLRPGLDKYILHLRWDQSATMKLDLNVIFPKGEDAPRELVVVLHPYTSMGHVAGTETMKFLFCDTVNAMLEVMNHGGTVTFVGHEGVDFRQASGFDDVKPRPLKIKVRNLRLLKPADGGIQYVTLDEWHHPSCPSHHNIYPSTMTPVIDHTAHPHIVDAILDACDTPTLVSFRATSRAFRDKSNARLFAHCATDGQTLVSALGGARLPAAWGEVKALDVGYSNPNFTRLDGLSKLRRLEPDALNAPDGLDEALDALDGLDVLVDFVSLVDEDRWVRVPCRLGRYVLHLRWREDNTMPYVILDVDFSEGRRPDEWVIVLHPCAAADEEPAAEEDTLSFLLQSVVDSIVDVVRNGTVTFVGLESVSPRTLGGVEDTPAAKTAAIKGMLAEIWLSEGLVEPDELDATLSKVTFVSLDEWRAGLDEEGGDALALQCCWPNEVHRCRRRR